MRIHRDHRFSFNPKSEIRNPKSRGVTLIEVLIAMFVMAIGLLGILALFPMGLLQMQQAVKDERTAQTAKVMEIHAKYLWREAWIARLPAGAPQMDGVQEEYMVTPTIAGVLIRHPELIALDNSAVPDNNAAAILAYLNSPNYLARKRDTIPSTPVFIDAIGYQTQPANTSQFWVGYPLQLLPRRNISLIATLAPALRTPARLRLCGLMDDLTFDVNGQPSNPVQRAGDYNASYVLRRERNNVRTEVNLTVVVYRRRSPADTFSPETWIGNATMAQGQREFTLVPNAGIPMPKVGTWLLALRAAPPANPANALGIIEEFADFYRVVSVTPTGNAWRVEVAQSVRNRAQNSAGYVASIVQMENVAEVFDKGTLTINDRPTE